MLLVLKSETFPLQPTEGTINPGMSVRVPRVSGRESFKILTPKQLFQRLPVVALAQAKAGNCYILKLIK